MMTPTLQFRWFDSNEHIRARVGPTLQQYWHEDAGQDDANGHVIFRGEWRDVPLVIKDGDQ